MTPEDFCSHHLFELDPELQSNGRYLIHILDRGKRIFPNGRREGTMYIHPTTLDDWLIKCHRELMDLILDKLYK